MTWSAAQTIALARGVRVHISDGSPQAFCGYVTAMRGPDALTRDSRQRCTRTGDLVTQTRDSGKSMIHRPILAQVR